MITIIIIALLDSALAYSRQRRQDHLPAHKSLWQELHPLSSPGKQPPLRPCPSHSSLSTSTPLPLSPACPWEQASPRCTMLATPSPHIRLICRPACVSEILSLRFCVTLCLVRKLGLTDMPHQEGRGSVRRRQRSGR